MSAKDDPNTNAATPASKTASAPKPGAMRPFKPGKTSAPEARKFAKVSAAPTPQGDRPMKAYKPAAAAEALGSGGVTSAVGGAASVTVSANGEPAYFNRKLRAADPPLAPAVARGAVSTPNVAGTSMPAPPPPAPDAVTAATPAAARVRVEVRALEGPGRPQPPNVTRWRFPMFGPGAPAAPAPVDPKAASLLASAAARLKTE